MCAKLPVHLYDGVSVRKPSLKGHRYPYSQAHYKEKNEHGFEK